MRCWIKLLICIIGCAFLWPAYAESEAKPTVESTNQAEETKETRLDTAVIEKPVQSELITAALKLEQSGRRLYAKVLIQQITNIPGNVSVVWAPPLHSVCQKSSYVLPYRGKTFHTQSYRTVIHSTNNKPAVCSGEWIVKIKDGHGVELAMSSFNISPLSRQDTIANKKTLVKD